MATVLVTGANGFVGSNVVPALAGDGRHVVALVRTEAHARDLLDRLTDVDRGRVETRLGDVTRIETLRSALAGGAQPVTTDDAAHGPPLTEGA